MTRRPNRRSEEEHEPASGPAPAPGALAGVAEGREGVLSALRAGLEEALPGLRILDADLVLDERGRADLAGVDATGRLVLVLLAGEAGDRTALEALDAHAFAHANAVLLARHLDSGVDPAAEPRIVVVDPSNDPVLAERLGPLTVLGIEVHGVRTLRSASGEVSFLVPRGGASGPLPSGGGLEDLLEGLGERERELARRLAERMARLDDELVVGGDARSLVWRYQGAVLARLERAGDELRASVGTRRPTAALRDPEDVDRLVEGALARLVERLDPLGEGRLEPAMPEAAPGGARAAELPMASEPLLTPEEIEAFRE